jgi:hypothetical protein
MKNLFSPEGREKIMNDIKMLFKYLWIDVKKALIQSIPGGSLLYSDDDAAKEKKAIEEEGKLYDARAEAAKKNVAIEADATAAKMALEKDGISKAEKEIAQRANDMAQKHKEMEDEKDSVKKAIKAQEIANLQKEQDRAQEIVKLAKGLDQTKAQAIRNEYDTNKKSIAENEAKIKEMKNPTTPNYQEMPDGQYVPMMAGGGDLSAGQTAMVGEQGPEFVKGPASVTSSKDTNQLLSTQNSLVDALNVLNMQTAKLIALNAEQEKHQKIMAEKLNWTGNLFE